MKALKKLLAVAVIATSAQSAFAFWDTGVDTAHPTNPNNGEMILTLFDDVTQNSYSQDTGIRFSALTSGTAFNGQSIALDATGISVFGGNLSNVRWSLAAAGSHNKNGTTPSFLDQGYILSTNSTPATIANNKMAGNVNGTYTLFTQYASQLNMTSGTIANEVMTETAGGAKYPTQWLQSLDGKYDTTAFDLGTLNLWFTGYGNNAGTLGKQVIEGTATLDILGGKLTLNSNTPTVPVPAAAWLLGSALTGLGAVARKRRAKA